MTCAICSACRKDPRGGCIYKGPFTGYVHVRRASRVYNEMEPTNAR
jgi:hypothetical protein